MASGSTGTPKNATSSINVVEGQQPLADDRNKTPRHPRWTRQETLVLIEGKRLAEERGRRGRRSSVFGADQLEPKWEAVSSHCRRHGVNRGPVQCRKRWSNLLSDFKKINTWETEYKREEGESFWRMRSDLRREKKLPGFFDREIYDFLDGKASTAAAYQLALVPIDADENIGDSLEGVEDEDEDEMMDDEEAGIGQFYEFEQAAQEETQRRQGKEKVWADDETEKIPSPVPVSEMHYQPYHWAYSHQGNKRQPGPHFRRDPDFQEGAKRRKSSSDSRYIDVDELLIKAVERNNDLLNAQLEDQKSNFQLDREQRKEQYDSLIASLTKISNALEKIADKLQPQVP